MPAVRQEEGADRQIDRERASILAARITSRPAVPITRASPVVT
jgi:hypothetical protein